MMTEKSEKLKNILKIAALWTCCSLILIYLLKTIVGTFDFGSVDDTFTFMFKIKFWYLIPFVFFLPTSIYLWFACKRYQTTWGKILCISFLIPFTNMICYFAEEIIARTMFGLGAFYSMGLGFISLTLLVILFFSTLVTPKNWLRLKKEFLLTEVCMLGFASILIPLTLFITGIAHDYLTKKALSAYQPAIEYTEFRFIDC